MSRRTILGTIVSLALFAAALAPSSALAAFGEGLPVKPWLALNVSSTPSHLAPGMTKGDVIAVSATNLGDAPLVATKENPVKITLVLPPGFTVGTAGGTQWPPALGTGHPHIPPVCSKSGERTATCTFEGTVQPYERFEISAGEVGVPGTPGEPVVEATATGGEGPKGETVTPPPVFHRSLIVSSEPTPFGVESYEVTPEAEDGSVDTQAGSHPFQFTTQLNLNTIFVPHEVESEGKKEIRNRPENPAPLRNVNISLPPGLLGDTQSVPQCSDTQFAALTENGFTNKCPADTVLGASLVFVNELLEIQSTVFPVPVVNLVPARGEPARFGFTVVGVPVIFDTEVRGGDFRVKVSIRNSPMTYPILSSLVTIWGNPGDVRHDSSRGLYCLAGGFLSAGQPEAQPCKPPPTRPTQSFLTLPTSCGEEPVSAVEALSWASGATYTKPMLARFPEPLLSSGFSNCGALDFHPELSVQPTQTTTSTPTGLKVKLTVPQANTVSQEKLAEADIRNTTVTLPKGVQLNPSAANGLAACSESAAGYTGPNPTTGTLEFAPEVANEESKAEEAAREAAGTLCPKESKVGTVRLKTPLLATELTGNVFLAAQEANPFGSLFAMYVIVKDPVTGVVVKLAGRIDLDPTTGQVTSTFPNAPQDPFDEFELNIFDGPRASLTTPRDCGTYTTESAFQSWSSGTPIPSFAPAEGGLQFSINEGQGGTACLGLWPFAPSVQAGSTTNQAGALTGFNVVLARNEGDQAPTNLTMTLPPGLAGYLTHVTQCPEPQANEGTCGPESLIGEAKAVSGLGPDPYTVTGGRVYITGPYTNPKTGHTSPFGLSVVIPAIAGPFNFGNVVTRSSLDIDKSTTQLTINSELPTMVEAKPVGGGPTKGIGAPVQLRRVEVTVNRPNFQFNPTNCTAMNITGAVNGEQGSVQPFNEPFQVQGCDKLPFHPELTAETDSRYSRTEGTELRVVVKAHPGEANVRYTKIIFPEQLPSRLTTLQKACLAATFEANPASCPPGSVIGTAVAHTPVLNVPLQGPVYLVARGSEFPDAEFVLQGEGITVVLDGKTAIHHGVTSSTFETVPDAPFETFEVNLPKKSNSAFTGFENLCAPTTTVFKKVTITKKVGSGKKKKTVKVKKTVEVKEPIPGGLSLPTTLKGQNGDEIQETLPLKVKNCAPAKKAVKHSKAKKKAKKKKRKK
jgi:hypothetical protein